jgi:hypothetical protein
MNQPPVFISCVSSEFGQTRRRIADILRRLGYTPVVQQIFGTEPGDLRQALRDKINPCEGLIQIVGQGYGAEPPTIDANYGRVSYTQFEFLYARSQKKKTWLIFARDACSRDTPPERLDLPNDPAHPDPAGYQAERRALQLAYHEKRRNDGHLYYDATSDTDLDLTVERLRDELAELRRAEEEFRRELLAGLAKVAGQLDWQRIARITSLNLEATRDRIAHIHLPRSSLVTTLKNSLEKARLVILHGDSGSGKSALAGRFTKDLDVKSGVCVFLRGADLESEEIQNGIRTSDHKLLFPSVQSSRAHFVIDGVEACRSEESWMALTALLRGCGIERADSPWRVILSCQTRELDTFLLQLTQRLPETISYVDFVEVDLLAENEVLQVIAHFQRLAPLNRRPRVLDVLRNAKILEVVVARLTAVSLRKAEDWVGETSVVQWWWKEVVLEGKSVTQRGHFLVEFATQLATKARTELPAGLFPNDSSIINGLIEDGVLSETESRIRFAHDLYSDWSRMRALLEMGPDASTFLPTPSCVELPQWHHAIRLFGAHLIETPPQNYSWRELIGRLGNQDSASLLTRDLLVEAAIFAGEPLQALESIWSDLAGNKGELLKRFLFRFQHTATIPDPRIDSEDPRMLSQLAAICRLPYRPLWPPVLSWMERHIDEMTAIDPAACARIAKLWLELANTAEGSGQPAASIALRVAQSVAQQELSRSSRLREDTVKTAYEALLSAARELPDQVSTLVLKIAGRQRWDTSELPSDVNARFLGKWERARGGFIPPQEIVDEPPQSWLDGPTAFPLNEIQEVLLDPSNCGALLERCPKTLEEALLAVLISWPKSRLRNPRDLRAKKHGFQFVRNDFPPRYWKTPFLSFFRRHPEYALECLIKLVNFATDRTCDQLQVEFGVRPSIQIELDGEKTIWTGDQRVFAWHRYPKITIHTIGSSLMAFEKWLYEELEAGRSVDVAIATIFRQSRSLAFLGVLLSVGKKFPQLLIGPLRPLLFIRDLYLFDQRLVMYRNVNGPSVGEGRWQKEAILEWEKMEHRKLSLHGICLHKFRTEPSWRELFSEVRTVWILNAEAAEKKEERLAWLRWAARFDQANWSTRQNPDGTVYHQFALPKELEDQQAEKLHAERAVLLSAPFQCRELLSKQTKLKTDELERLWNHLKEVAAWNDDSVLQEDELDAFSFADAVCGYIAVLVVSHQDWLRAHPDRLEWCKQRLLQIVKAPPPLRYFSKDDVMDHFDDFASQAIVELWADEPDSIEIRAAVAKLALSFRYKTVALLSSQAEKMRCRLGKSYYDLESLLLRSSAARLSRDLDWFTGATTFDVEVLQNEWLAPFVESKMPPPPSTWKEIAVPEKRQEGISRGREIEPKWPDVDIPFLLAVYAWIPSLDEAPSEAERKRQINVGCEFSDAIARRFEIPLEANQHFSGVPNQTDCAAFRLVSKILLEMREDEDPKRLWHPMLKIGPKAHYWVHYFFTEFFSFDSHAVGSRFIKRWKDMLEFAFRERAWTDGHFWKAGKAWEHLCGFDSVTAIAWTEERQAVVQEIKAYYWRWLNNIANRPADVLPFLRFLQSPAAQSIVCESLTHLERLFSQRDDYFWRDLHYGQLVSNFVGHLWSRHYERIKSSPDLLPFFRSLVSRLAAYQDPLALEIIASIGSNA